LMGAATAILSSDEFLALCLHALRIGKHGSWCSSFGEAYPAYSEANKIRKVGMRRGRMASSLKHLLSRLVMGACMSVRWVWRDLRTASLTLVLQCAERQQVGSPEVGYLIAGRMGCMQV
jgi:hypothetical protein